MESQNACHSFAVKKIHSFVLVDDLDVAADVPDVDSGTVHEHRFVFVGVAGAGLGLHGDAQDTHIVRARDGEQGRDVSFLEVLECEAESNEHVSGCTREALEFD